MNGCSFSRKSRILHKGSAHRALEASGCLFDMPDPFRREKDGDCYATRCRADSQDNLFDGRC